MNENETSPAFPDFPDDVSLTQSNARRFPREVILLGAVCFVLAAILRFVHISYREFYGDEFFTLDFLSGPRPELLGSIFFGKLPLYYEFLRGWAAVFGSTSELMLRLPSAILGLLTFVAFFFFAANYLRGAALAISLLAFALNPTLLATSNEATSFAALGLFVVLANHYCVRALDQGGSRNWTLYGLCALLGAITHPLFWFVLLAHFAFAVARPRQTPRPFVLVSSAGIFLLTLLMIAAALYADHHFPKKVDVQTPAVDDLMRGLVSVVMGDFTRYETREFVRAIMYLFLILSLSLSFLYYYMRQLEASAMPENVLWIDETQDVVGDWRRLSLASFLLFHWVTFAVPAFAIMLLGTFSSSLVLKPEYFLVCLPPMVFLMAAGMDGAPGRIGTIIMSLIFIGFMGAYSMFALGDKGFGVYDAYTIMRQDKFDASKDVLLIVPASKLERSTQQYAGDIKGVPFSGREDMDLIKKRVAEAVAGKQRVYILYHDDFKRYGKAFRSPVREWIEANKAQYSDAKRWELSPKIEKTELRRYIKAATPAPAK